MLGYCPLCDKYRSFELNGTILHCSHCGWDTPNDQSSNIMVEEVEVQAEIGTFKLQPLLLRITSTANTFEALDALMWDTANYGEIFGSQYKSAIMLAAHWKVSVPALAVFETPNRAYSAARAILVNPDGSIVAYERKPMPTIPVTLPPVNYYAYIQTQEWRKKRQEALERASYRCQVCNSSESPLDGHHRTYKNLGHEEVGDVIVLCRNCHDLFHFHRRLARN